MQQLDLKHVDDAAAAADDMRLLRLYAEGGDEKAFAQLVSRHMGWVYSACKRGLRDKHLAEDAAQAVFLTLARRAKTISDKVRLSGWLFKTTRFAVADARKREMRHQRRQEVAAEQATAKQNLNLTGAEAQLWEVVAPNMDDALAYLCEKDRQAVVLHFFEGLSFSEMGPILGLSKEGAKKRVSRAIDKLKAMFARKGTVVTAPVLMALMYARAVEAAPAGMAEGIAAAAMGQAPASYMTLAIARGIVNAMNNTVTMLVKAMLAAEAAAILLVAVVAMKYGGIATSGTVAVNKAAGDAKSELVIASESPAQVAVARKKQSSSPGQAVMLRSPWAPVDERPYAAGELEAAAAAVDEKAPRTADDVAMADAVVASQLVSFDGPAGEMPASSTAAAGGGNAGGAVTIDIREFQSGGRLSARLMGTEPLAVGAAGWGGALVGGVELSKSDLDKRDSVAEMLDPQLRGMIDSLLRTGDGDLIVVRQDGKFHFYLPDAINGSDFADWDPAFANYTPAELRRALGWQNYRKLLRLADSPELQLEYVRAVPEPGMMAGLCIAGMLLIRRRRA